MAHSRGPGDAAPAGDPSEWRLRRLPALSHQDGHAGVVSLSPIPAPSTQENGIAGDKSRPIDLQLIMTGPSLKCFSMLKFNSSAKYVMA